MLALFLEAALRSLALGGIVWLGLKLLRVRDPRAHMTAWTVVLVASLAMPLIMHWAKLTLPSDSPPSRLAEIIWVSPGSPLEALPAADGFSQAPAAPVSGPASAEARRDAMPTTADRRAVRWGDWLVVVPALATGVYVLVAGVLLLRLLVGVMLTWCLVRAARPLGDGWARGLSVRVSDLVGVPVTFGSTVLLPPEYIEWSPAKRQAVLCHERSHVAHGDCYVLLLAALNRAVFWFSPFAWWQLTRLAELAEIISDDAAVAALADRASYARILLDLAGHVQRAPAGLAMARAATVGWRVERILAASAAPARMGWRKQIVIATALAPVVAICAGSIARGTPPQVVAALPLSPEFGRVLPDDLPPEAGPAARVDPRVHGSYAGYYRLDPRSVFAITRDGNQLFAQLTGERRFRIFPENDREFLYRAGAARITFVADGERPPTELILHQNGQDLRAVRIVDVPNKDAPRVEVAAETLDSHVGWYELNASRVLAVTREGDRLFVEITGRSKFQVVAHSERDFVSADGNAVVIFMAGQGPSSELLLHEPGLGARSAPRVDAARATAIQDAFARWVAAAPDRFKDQMPAQGGKAAVLEAIEGLQRNAPNYGRMSPQLADGVRRNVSGLHTMLTALGGAESVFFRGVGPGGYDIYGAKFANGFAEFRILMGADGRTEDLLFRPDGDDTPGGFAACSDEPTLRAASGTAPIKVVVYNTSGADIELFELDADGRRQPYGTIGDERSAPIQAYVRRPWVVADASGRCLNIILPGQRARFLAVQPPEAAEPHVAFRRTAPLPGSEDALRRYIDAVGRGEPNYDQMTPEVAAQTRQQLLLDQAILAKLGALRAMSFRGTTQIGNDIYMVHFANGTAEWRIGLVKEGRIGRIALGPQY
jgi:hypothetical protein